MAFLPLWSSYLSADNEEAVSQIPLKGVTDVRHGRNIHVPVSAYYWRQCNQVQVSTLSDLGVVMVSVTNLTTGDLFSSILDTSITTDSMLSLNDTPGVYELVIYTECGCVLMGSFAVD